MSDKRLAAAIQFAAMCLLLLCIFTGVLGPVLNAAIRSFAASMTGAPAAPAQPSK